MKNNKNTKGITLIALIITIIVILILVTVTVNMAINGGLFEYAGKAVSETTISSEKEFISLCVLETMAANKYGNVEKEGLQEIINNNKNVDGAITVYETNNKFLVVYEEENRAYKVDSTGEVTGAIEIDVATGEIIADGTTYSSIEEYLLGGTKVEIAKGSFVEYDVAYTDVYYSSYNYTTTNGWRILDYTDNGDGTYSDVKIISTGVPARLYYYYNDTTNSTWYVTDDTKLTAFRSLLGSDYTFYTGTSTYYGLRASAGMYYNFSDIKFAYATANRGKSLGYFTSITSNETTYDADNTAEVTGEDLFNLYGTKATVRLLTLTEVNEALGREDIDSMTAISTTEDAIGLYRLNQLVNVDGMSSYTYTTGFYWLASPYPYTSSNGNVCIVDYNGNVNYYGASTNIGVRPVVCLESDIMLLDTNGNGVAEIIFK